MIISWLGQSCFKLQGKDATLITDPYDPKIGFKLPKLTADIVTISHEHFDHSYVEAVSGDPFVVDSPGEFEVKNVFVTGIQTFHDAKGGQEKGQNIIYRIEMDDLVIVHLGDLGHELEEKHLELLGKTDILMVPVGGQYTISAKQAMEIINQIEPRIVIPMHYKIPGLAIDLEPLDKFCKELGCSPSDTTDKLKISQKELPVEETKIIILAKT